MSFQTIGMILVHYVYWVFVSFIPHNSWNLQHFSKDHLWTQYVPSTGYKEHFFKGFLPEYLDKL